MRVGQGWKRSQRKIAVILLLLPAPATTVAAESRASNVRVPSIAFRFQPIRVSEQRAFHVVVTFRAGEALTKIVVPTTFGGASHLEAAIQNLKVNAPEATLEDGDSAGNRKLKARAGERVELEYDLVSNQAGQFRHPAEHRPIINADYFLFNTDNALVFPEFPPSGMVRATFDFRALPKGIPLLTSFGINKRVIRVRVPWFRVDDALFAGGDFRVTQSHENGSTLVLAARGKWRFTDAEAFATVRKVMDTENCFWHVRPIPYFLVTLAPFDEDSRDNDGSGFTDAFALFLSRQDTFDADRVRLVAHEMFHHWNPMSMGPQAADEVAQWFTEGFTIYYGGVIPLRSRLTSFQDYLAYMNRWLRRYQLSPMRKFTKAQWGDVSHTSGPGYELSYARGAAVALWADAAIRARSGGKASLDDVMYEMLKEAQPPDNPPELTENRVIGAFAGYLSADQMGQLRAIVVEGADVPLPQKLGNCAERKDVTRTVVDPGFDEATSLDKKRMTGVDPNGPAYRAGIRDGQDLFRWSIYGGDPTKDVVLGVMVDGSRKTVHYSAAKQQEVAEYQSAVGGEAAQACTPF